MQQLFYLQKDLKNHSWKYSSSVTTIHSVYLVYIFMIPVKFVLVFEQNIWQTVKI